MRRPYVICHLERSVRLIPRDEQFYELFTQLAERLSLAARLLNQLFREPERREPEHELAGRGRADIEPFAELGIAERGVGVAHHEWAGGEWAIGVRTFGGGEAGRVGAVVVEAIEVVTSGMPSAPRRCRGALG